ncbi:MAG: hypothetical protein DRP12_03305 [Candidatus Aenigmatarchaeota archaeon]|nr:MAG: hypothetical protein DRP12_03305 [Candidatus Aenigmarchaeota archaeon]
MYSVIIFDWSGTISDDREPVYRANMLLLKYFDQEEVDFERWIKNIGSSVLDFYRAEGINTEPEELVKLFSKFYDEVCFNGVKPKIYPEVKETLQFLKKKNVRMAVLSAHPQKHLLAEAREYGIDHFFELIRGGCWDKAEGLRKVCREMGINLKRKRKRAGVLYVGDTTHDIKSAHEAGIASAWVDHGYHKKEDIFLENLSPEHLLANLTGLKYL